MIKTVKNYFTKKTINFTINILQNQGIQDCLRLLFHKILLDEASLKVITDIMRKKYIYEQFWINANIRPEEGKNFSYASFPSDLTEESFKLAARQSAQYVHENMVHLYGIPFPLDLLTTCINEVTIDGLYLEFGVFSGQSINHIASKTKKIVHGFDSFQGIPEDWNSVPAGTFSTNGQLPNVSSNVKLHIGFFEDTLQNFKNDFSANVAFMHIDSDLYSSARTVLSALKDRITKGTIIVFDEYFNYPGWQKHEYLAFKEFISETGHQYEHIAFCSKGFSVGVKII